MTVVEPIRSKADIVKIEKYLEQHNYRDLLLFVIGINSGLRISDILKLNVSDIKNKTQITIKEQKSGKIKQFPLNKKLIKMIKSYIKNRNSDEPLFITKFNNRMDRFTAYDIINNACKQNNIKYNVGTHTLRKTFGYHFYKKYKDIAMLQRIFNHSSPQITLRYIGIEQDEINFCYENFIL